MLVLLAGLSLCAKLGAQLRQPDGAGAYGSCLPGAAAVSLAVNSQQPLAACVDSFDMFDMCCLVHVAPAYRVRLLLQQQGCLLLLPSATA
jgi:hypothetical protein